MAGVRQLRPLVPAPPLMHDWGKRLRRAASAAKPPAPPPSRAVLPQPSQKSSCLQFFAAPTRKIPQILKGLKTPECYNSSMLQLPSTSIKTSHMLLNHFLTQINGVPAGVHFYSCVLWCTKIPHAAARASRCEGSCGSAPAAQDVPRVSNENKAAHAHFSYS